MNDFQLADFDYSSGEMAWKELSLVLPTAGYYAGIVQVDVGVANVDDNLYDSLVYIDYITQVAGAYLSNMDEKGFNGVGNPFCFSLQNQEDNFVTDSAQSPIELSIQNNEGVTTTVSNFVTNSAGDTISVDEFVYDSALGQLCAPYDFVTSIGPNKFGNLYAIELKAKTTSGNDVDSNFELYVGNVTLTVTLRHSDGSLYTGNMSVSLCKQYWGTCATEYHNNSSGKVVFKNIGLELLTQYTLNGGGFESKFYLQSDNGYYQSIDFAIE